MHIYIALLRGINVSGKNKIKMIELKQLFLDIGFSEVNTYIQSGNVIFSTNQTNTLKIEQLITTKIKEQFKYAVKVLILKKDELETAFNTSPFLNKTTFDLKKTCATFLDKIPTNEGILKVKELAAKNEIVLFKNKIAYLYCPNGLGSTKLTNKNIETKLKISATSRNWNTVTRLVELSNK
ncbi:DUF1697 domain-containing protein [Lutibacter sp. A80]|uniref:DUF1697 domain-containing protein n=1 Tax=Lutibacter sp. A80 TaxID=2918453 RepID=UPI001F05D032|nr:DUF1697 domain-containing protein [Lutibacter sp. A80]UMB60667.1 DUF1697 domain-containing protein [Lutibacter sp. A80]